MGSGCYTGRGHGRTSNNKKAGGNLGKGGGGGGGQESLMYQSKLPKPVFLLWSAGCVPRISFPLSSVRINVSIATLYTMQLYLVPSCCSRTVHQTGLAHNRICACVRACVRACVCVCACTHVRVWVGVCVHAVTISDSVTTHIHDTFSLQYSCKPPSTTNSSVHVSSQLRDEGTTSSPELKLVLC